VAQLSDLRRRSLEALGRERDELELRADAFLDAAEQRGEAQPDAGALREFAGGGAGHEVEQEAAAGFVAEGLPGAGVAVAWFPARRLRAPA
jgi:hypothetical protein